MKGWNILQGVSVFGLICVESEYKASPTDAKARNLYSMPYCLCQKEIPQYDLSNHIEIVLLQASCLAFQRLNFHVSKITQL
jgi:hypothetical protein